MVPVIAILLVVTLGVFSVYNLLVRGRNRVKNAFAQIDVQMQRRFDLIPNLVETCKAYMQHERETLTQVTAARQQAMTAQNALKKDLSNSQAMSALMQADQNLHQGMANVMAVVESYPDLKADQTLQPLLEELASTENRVGFARQAYNDAVTEYNNTRESFPAVMLAASLGFAAMPSWILENQEAKQSVHVSFH